MKRPVNKKSELKMTATTTRTHPNKTKVLSASKITIPKTASSGIKHQVILPKASTVIASSSPAVSASPGPLQNRGRIAVTAGVANHSSSSTSTTMMKTSSRPGRVSKRNGVWYLGGNHVVKLLTSVDGDLDHSVLSKLAAVPTVVGELALSVESLVSDDVTVGGFENDVLAKITSNTLTAKRGIMAAASASVATSATTSKIVSSVTAKDKGTAQPAPQVSTAIANETNNNPPAQVGEGQVPNPLLSNYQPVPNPLAIRITPPASPHTSVTEQRATKVPTPKAEIPMIQAR